MIRLALSQLLSAGPLNASGFTYDCRSLYSLQTQLGRAEQGRNRPLTIPTEGFLLETIDKMASKKTKPIVEIAIQKIIFFMMLQYSILFLIAY
jgi:hypothetical protein